MAYDLLQTFTETVHKSDGGTDLMLNGAINGPLHKSVVINCLPKLYILSTINVDLVLWHTLLIVYAVKCKIMGYFFHFSSLNRATYVELN